MKQPKLGTTFLHSRWLQPDKKAPLVCVVSAIRLGRIYYKSHGARKAFEHCSMERWPVVCKQILDADEVNGYL